jgi:heat shock protein HtpX
LIIKAQMERATLRLILLLALTFGIPGVVFALIFGPFSIILLAAGAVVIFYYYSTGPRKAIEEFRGQYTETNHPQLVELVSRLSKQFGIERPTIAIVPDPSLNAFAIGGGKHGSCIGVHQGLIEVLDRDEMEGVLAHEMAHIKHRDTLCSTIAIAVYRLVQISAIAIAAIVVFLIIFIYIILGGGRKSNGSGVAFGSALIGVGIAAGLPMLFMITRFAYSRHVEYEADHGAALVTKKPGSLASALEKMESWPHRTTVSKGQAIYSSLYTSPVYSDGLRSSLFSTHPPIRERVSRLRSMQMGPGDGAVAPAHPGVWPAPPGPLATSNGSGQRSTSPKEGALTEIGRLSGLLGTKGVRVNYTCPRCSASHDVSDDVVKEKANFCTACGHQIDHNKVLEVLKDAQSKLGAGHS